MNILYISSGASTKEYEEIEKKVKKEKINDNYGMPEASFKFHKLVIQGLVENSCEVKALIGRSVSLKTHYGILWKSKENMENGVLYKHLFFINLPCIKQICICIGMFFNILMWIFKNRKNDRNIIVDGAYITILPIINFISFFARINKICIVCDVYSYMADVNDANEKRSIKDKIISIVLKRQYQKMDGFVFITEEISHLSAFKNKPYTVIEGIVDEKITKKEEFEKYIMYAGALRKEYGVERLVRAFQNLKCKDYQLLLFGNGNYVDEIKKISKVDNRIKYMGKKSLNEIYEYEKKATLLVNPRFTNVEFTKYSFPSKNLEYMLSGTPLLTGKLPGMPLEYNDYVYLIEDDTDEALRKSLSSILKKAKRVLLDMGIKAQNFVSLNKNKKIQAKKIVELNKKIEKEKNNQRIKTMFTFNGFNKYIPIVLCGGFFLITILLLIFGPYDWHMENSKLVYTYLILAFILLVLGYVLAIKKSKIYEEKGCFNINRFLTKCIIIYILIYIPTLYIRTGKLYPDILTGIFNSGYAYKIAHNSNETLIEYLRIFFSPFIVVITPLTFMYFKRLNRFNKIAGIACILLNLMLGISCGISKQFADFVMQVFIFSLLLLFSNNILKSIKNKIIVILIMIITAVSFMFYYKSIMSNRVSSDMIENNIVETNDNKTDDNKTDDIQKNENKNDAIIDKSIIDDTMNNYSSFGYATLKEDNIIYKLIPTQFKSSTMYLISYVTHGYKGLSFAMSKPFTSSYGLGFSEFFRHNFSRFFGNNFEDYIYERTYMSKIEENGWYTLNVWSTFFIYPASDIGFILTLVLIFFIGYAFGYSWKDSIITGNIYASCVFYNFVILIFYLSANNQLFQTGEAFVSSVFIFTCYIVYLIKRRSYLK